MSQVFHILRKDARRHIWEILLCLAAVVAYTWREVHVLGTPFEFSGPVFGVGIFVNRFWAVGAAVLLPASWFILIFRVIQSEPLAGDNQFWITRPYEWKKLLAAKVTFILVWINLPMLIAGVFLLTRAGFSPAPHWFGLLWVQVLLIWIPLAPIMTLAAVTRGVAQGLLVVLGFVLWTACMLAAVSVVDSPMSSSDLEDWLLGPCVVVMCLVSIWLQYSGRKTNIARLSLGMGLGAITLLSLTPYFLSKESEYPLPSDGKLPAFQMSIGEGARLLKGEIPDKDEPVEIAVPILTGKLPDDEVATVKGVILTMDGSDGFRWTSAWLRQSSYQILTKESNRWDQHFQFDRETFKRVKSVPMKIRVAVAIELYRERKRSRIIAGREEFEIPEVGRCRIDPYNLNNMLCHSPLLRPSNLTMRMDTAASTCPVSTDDQRTIPDETLEATLWGQSSGIAEYGFSPVETFNFYFTSRWPARSRRGARSGICPGTPIDISFLRLAGRTRVQAEVADFKMEDYYYPPQGYELRVR